MNQQIRPDITMAFGDDPIYVQQLRWPPNEDGTPGDPMNLAGATGVLRLQDRAHARPWVDVTATPATDQTPGSATEGDVEVDFNGLDLPAGDYDYRYIMNLVDGRQESVPAWKAGATCREFFWLHVAADFVVVA